LNAALHTKLNAVVVTAVLTDTVKVVALTALIQTDDIPDAARLEMSVSWILAAFGVKPRPCVTVALVALVAIVDEPWFALTKPTGFPDIVMSLALL
jgi:hypothetical protein